MLDERKIEAAAAEFTKNPYWRKDWEEAPTAESRRAPALGFFTSWYAGKISGAERKEAIDERDRLRNQFVLEDWRHELKYCGHNPYHAVCAKKVAELYEEAQV